MKDEGQYERTYDGKTWEPVSETEMRERLEGLYMDVDAVIDMINQDSFEARGFGCYYRAKRIAANGAEGA